MAPLLAATTQQERQVVEPIFADVVILDTLAAQVTGPVLIYRPPGTLPRP